MRLLRFATKASGDVSFLGVQQGKSIIDVSALLAYSGIAAPTPLSTRAFLGLGFEAINCVKDALKSETGPRVALAEVTLKAPIKDCEKIICIGMNYVDHCTEQNIPVPTEPILFNKFPSTLADPGEDIIKVTDQTNELDFEVELAIVIGKEGKEIKQSEAMDYVFGYTAAHDVSARDWQLKRNGGQWLLGKTFDSYSPIGPAIVSSDELGDAHKLGVRTFVNGKTVQDSNTDQMIFRTEFLVEWCSRYVTLKPGDMIFTGTPPGVGCFRKPQLFLKHGDVVTVEIDGIGAITNKVREVAPRL
jgi:2-keto-4-pentenoate hydratase/2-oxohepta-3-ene-1,7-dioic acid hydratase in catechol pathway